MPLAFQTLGCMLGDEAYEPPVDAVRGAIISGLKANTRWTEEQDASSLGIDFAAPPPKWQRRAPP
jgi:hypothetical protein